MPNPYAPSAEPESLQGNTIPDSVSEVSFWMHVGGLLAFALGCIIALHTVVAVQQGPGVAIERTLRDPVNSISFFVIVVSVSFLAVTGWKAVRRRLRPDFAPTPATRFAAGFVLVILYLVFRMLAVTLLGTPPRNQAALDLLRGMATLLPLLVTAVTVVELEAVIVRFRRREPPSHARASS